MAFLPLWGPLLLSLSASSSAIEFSWAPKVFKGLQWTMTSPAPKGLFTLICLTLSEARSYSSELKAFAGSPLHSYEALSGCPFSLHYWALSALRVSWTHRPWVCLSFLLQLWRHKMQVLHGLSHGPSTVAGDAGLHSSTVQGLCHVRRHTLICLDCCSSHSCLLEPTLSSRSHKSHLPWGSLQLVFPSSAGHRPSQRYLLLKLTIHSLYLIIQQNLSSTWVVLGRVEPYFG